MNELLPLHLGDEDVRMVMRDGEPWWVLNDVAPLLDLTNPSKLTSRLEDYQKDGIPIRDTTGRTQRLIIVNEAGIYALTLNSRKPEAKAFAKKLFTEVLPSIRKHGCYPPPPQLVAIPEDDGCMIPDHEKSIAQRFREERIRIEALTGYSLANIPSMSKQIITAIENDMGGVTKGQRIRYLALAGVDVLYVLTGRRTIPRPLDRAQLSIGEGCL